MKILLHENKKIDRVLKRILSIALIIGLVFAGFVKFFGWLDPWWMTEKEVIIIDEASMKAHNEDVASTPYAMIKDVNRVINTMLEEQITDWTEDIKQIEDREDVGPVTAADLRIKERAKVEISKAKDKKLPE